MGPKQIGLIIAAVAALGGLLAGAAAWRASDAAGGTDGDSVSVGGDGRAVHGGQGNGCVAVGDSSTVNCGGVEPSPVDPDAADEAVEQALWRDTPPEGDGPWAFNVLYDKEEGLFSRDSPEEDGERIGYSTHGSVVYVACVMTSGFDPEPGRGHGPDWYHVHWPNTLPSEEAMRSSPSQPLQGWAWSFYLRPNGHNGAVPEC